MNDNVKIKQKLDSETKQKKRAEAIADPVQLLPLTSDIVFKQVFGQEESKPILRVFLNDVLGLDIKSADQITLLNPTIDPKYLDDKMCILDVRVQLSDRSSIDVEIQVLNRHNMESRALYYACQLCTEQLHAGDDYAKIAPVYGLNLLCFDLYEDTCYYRSFVLKDRKTNTPYKQKFEIAFFELRKAVGELSRTKEVKTLALSELTARDRWALFINFGKKEVYEKLVEEDKTFEEAYERLKKASSDEKLMAMYRSREKAIRDWNDSINSARKEGEQQGEARGLEKGRQEGRITELIELVRDGLLDVQKAAERAGMTLEEFQAAMKKE